MKIPKELIEQLYNDYEINYAKIECIANRAIEWERERLAKLAGEPVGDGFTRQYQTGDSPSTFEIVRIQAVGTPTYTQDQLLGAIVRAEDAEARLKAAIDTIARERFTNDKLLEQLAQCKADAERYGVLALIVYPSKEAADAHIDARKGQT